MEIIHEFYTTYTNVDLAHYKIVRVKAGKGDMIVATLAAHLNNDMCLHLHPYFTYESSKGSRKKHK